MRYSPKDFVSDAIVVSLLGALAFGAFRLVRPRLGRIWESVTQGVAVDPSLLPKGTPLRDGWTVEDLNGRPVALSQFEGKVIFLNFWATWCGPCRQELPSIEKLYAAVKNNDVVFLCVSEEDIGTLKTFVEKHHLQVPVYSSHRIPPAWGVRGLPTTYILGRDGKVVLGRVGASRWNSKKIIRLIDSLNGPAV